MDWLGVGAALCVAFIGAGVSLYGARSARAAQHDAQAAQQKLSEADAELSRSMQRAEQEAARSRDLEGRLSDRKFGVYEPIIEALSAMLVKRATGPPPPPIAPEVWANFGTWMGIFGSDDALRAWRNLQQASFLDAPPVVLMRLFADFMIEARRDMGDDATSVTRSDLLGMRLKDLYSDANTRAALEEPWEVVQQRTGWAAPW